MPINTFYLDELTWTMEKIHKHVLGEPTSKFNYGPEDWYDEQIQSEQSIRNRTNILYQTLLEEFYNLGKHTFAQDIISFKTGSHHHNRVLKYKILYCIELLKPICKWLLTEFILFKQASIIKINYDSFSYSEANYDLEVYLVIRSGFQFMFDLFIGFDQELDNSLYFLRENVSNCLGREIEGIVESCQYFMSSYFPYGMPSHHKWWPKY